MRGAKASASLRRHRRVHNRPESLPDLEETGLIRAQVACPSSHQNMASFLFLYFSKKNYRNIFLVFRFYSFVPLPPGRGRQGAYRPAGRR